MQETEPEELPEDGKERTISGLGQKIIGGLEEIGGILTGDPMTEAEGSFNVGVGEIREELEEDIEDEPEMLDS